MELPVTHIGFNDFNKNISEIVQSDYRTADVFKKFGINYCCSGKVLLKEACLSQNISLEAVQQELNKVTRTLHLPNNLQFDHWRLDFLIDYISHIHHSYLRQTLPELEASLFSFVNNHKKKIAGLEDLLGTFEELSLLLLAHVQHEDETIFPYIRQIENMHRRQEVYASLFIKTMRKSLNSVIDNEHRQISGVLLQLRSQTHNYKIPGNACTNHQVIYHKLHELDNDIVQHLHLENTVLYPKAMQIEQELLQLSNIH